MARRPGCVAAGDTAERAIANAAVALRMWAEGMSELPPASSLEALRQRRGVKRDLAAGSVAVSIPLIMAGRKQRLNIMLDPGLIAAADEAAETAGVSRSEFIARAVEETLARQLGLVTLSTETARSPRG